MMPNAENNSSLAPLAAPAAIPAAHLFEANTTRLGFRRDVWLRGFEYDFIELLAPQLTQRVVAAALKGGGLDAGL